jgi:hypothetical protein
MLTPVLTTGRHIDVAAGLAGAPDPSLPGIGSMITATLISEMGEDRASFI